MRRSQSRAEGMSDSARKIATSGMSSILISFNTGLLEYIVCVEKTNFHFFSQL